MIGASTGLFGARWSQAERRKTLSAAGARVTDRELPLAAAHEAFNGDGTLKDDDVTELDAILAELLDTTRQRLAA